MTKPKKRRVRRIVKMARAKIAIPMPCEINGGKVFIDVFLNGPTYEENCL